MAKGYGHFPVDIKRALDNHFYGCDYPARFNHSIEYCSWEGWQMTANTAKTAMQLVAEAKARIENLSVEQVAEEVRRGDVVLVDLRESEERLHEGAIPGALHAPRGMLEFYADPTTRYHKSELDPAKRIILHCAAGGRSALATETLKQMGYTNVAHLEGGFAAWKQAGQPVEQVGGQSLRRRAAQGQPRGERGEGLSRARHTPRRTDQHGCDVPGAGPGRREQRQMSTRRTTLALVTAASMAALGLLPGQAEAGLFVCPGLASDAAFEQHGAGVLAVAPLDPAGFPSIVHAGQLGPWQAHINSPVIQGPSARGECTTP
jgi:rhodanese-related sulfurtransferase